MHGNIPECMDEVLIEKKSDSVDVSLAKTSLNLSTLRCQTNSRVRNLIYFMQLSHQ